MSEENQVVEKTPEQIQVEKEARLMGWVDKSEYRDGEHWVDAETFVKRGKEINPILRKNNETLLKKLQERDAEIEEVKKVAAEFRKFTKENAERKVKELESELKSLREKKREAISAGDGDAVVEIDEAIDLIKEEQAAAKKAPEVDPEPAPKKQELDQDLVAWMNVNPWFGTNEELTGFADVIGKRIARQSPHLQGKAFLDTLDEELQKILPEEYRKPVRNNPVEAPTNGGNRPTAKSKRTYENLPADAKAACDRFVGQGLMTKEQYVAEYDWD